MNFALPYMLLALPFPFLFRWLPKATGRSGLYVPDHVYQGLEHTKTSRQRSKYILLAASWSLFIIALSGPQTQKQSDILPTSGRDIVLAMDLSGSMEQKDFVLDGEPISRLDAVKRVASAFAEARKGDRIGLVIFGKKAYFAQPLTYDVTAVANAIREAVIGISGRSTAISDGLGLAMRRLVESSAPTRVIILLSDGADTSGKVQATDAARLAAEHGIRVHTIALGPEDLENQPNSRDAVDSRTLREMAKEGNGQSFRVKKMSDLYEMANTLDQLEPSVSNQPPLLLRVELWAWPAAASLVLLIAYVLRRPE